MRSTPGSNRCRENSPSTKPGAIHKSRIALLRRFTEFTGSLPWDWDAGDVEDFTLSLVSGAQRLAPSTIRGYHMTLRRFCDYLLDARYGWVAQCEQRLGRIPSQVCYDFNTVAHLTDYEGRSARRPFTYDELQHLFDSLDTRVERIRRSGCKGAWVALRDAQRLKTCYAYGLRRRELCQLDLLDLRPIRTCASGACSARSTSATARRAAAVSPGGARC